jgi:holo-[acyl-carrier protein] synthase
MTKGIGIDIVDILRIENIINKYGNHFLTKVFLPEEIQYCTAHARPAVHFSGRWAVKEAFYKALPVHLQPESSWKSIMIVSSPSTKKPEITICSERLKKLLAIEGISNISISISHEKTHCIAIVIFESAG